MINSRGSDNMVANIEMEAPQDEPAPSPVKIVFEAECDTKGLLRYFIQTVYDLDNGKDYKRCSIKKKDDGYHCQSSYNEGKSYEEFKVPAYDLVRDFLPSGAFLDIRDNDEIPAKKVEYFIEEIQVEKDAFETYVVGAAKKYHLLNPEPDRNVLEPKNPDKPDKTPTPNIAEIAKKSALARLWNFLKSL